MNDAHDKFAVKKKDKKEKRPEKPSPFKIYPSNDICVPIAFARVSHFDDWRQRYVVEGRVRGKNRRPRNGWSEVATFTLSGEWSVTHGLECDWLDGLMWSMWQETRRYASRAMEWLHDGKSLDDLHRAMAIENGTIPKADTPFG